MLHILSSIILRVKGITEKPTISDGPAAACKHDASGMLCGVTYRPLLGWNGI